MAFQHFKNIKIQGFAACVPKNIESNENLELLGNPDQIKNFIKSTGIKQRHTVTGTSIRTSDMCLASAEKLIEELNWDKSEIDCLIFVSQTGDYIFPATSCILQNKLGLSNDCFTLDISLGCSGWIHGMATIAGLIQNGGFKKGILLVGDTSTMTKSPYDKSSYPLFGDAGTATAIEYVNGADGIKVHTSTDGKGHEAIIIPDGGFRNFYSKDSETYSVDEDGNKRNRLQTFMDGAAVFTFGITKAPRSVMGLAKEYNINLDEVDQFVFHQANKFMLEKIVRKLKIPSEKVPYSLNEYGNTSCSSIPLTIVSRLSEQVKNEKLKIMTCAFGVGLSWGSIYFETTDIVCPKVIMI
ncbi:ketoacyl-ACP synthase III [Brumimicrobium mesophilum]|uniref:ketoacyl-ACP synthase III n=1 Tax=Brumimicrobium mesophilum TaxID=392717 RepID=UPI000D141081|nr:ketoacyl-ACP synthase III [Brumimicrobium mesophilum]